MRTISLCALVMTTAMWCVIGAFAEEGEWKDLFNGENLDKWEVKGGAATNRIEGDSIVGASAPDTQNTFLCTKENYGDFILEFEFKGHPTMNSGVQVRSQSLPDYKEGRVHGYQVELEQNDQERDWSGGIYDESRRGWLYPPDGDDALAAKFSEEGKKCWKEDDWNQVRVEAIGNSIKTWINGQPRADLTDDMTASGFVGLQVHGVGDRKDPMSVRWRNIRIKEVTTEAGSGSKSKHEEK
ncbi:MAG: DUF1080 domain-containing protein [Candidatus Hydrogenedentes bacterium]|nr:DUF1080 domain-containing protein [Candidatus Hydrogenedentota bacterium]